MPSSERKKAYDRQYSDTHQRKFCLALSVQYDADIIAQLGTVSNKQGYIKSLIRADIAARAKSEQAEDVARAKTWHIVDDATTARGIIEATDTGTTNAAAALAMAQKAWDALSDHDRAARDDFYLVLGAKDEDGLLDWNATAATIEIAHAKKA